MNQETGSGNAWLLWALFGLMALVSLACIGTGGTVWAYGIQTWADHGHVFSGWQMLDWFVGLLGATLAGVGLLIAGFLFRFVRWQKAPLASLVLSILSLAFILGTYAIYSQSQSDMESADMILLQAGSFVGLFLVVLPPFLHWNMAKQGHQTAAATSPPAEQPAAKAP